MRKNKRSFTKLAAVLFTAGFLAFGLYFSGSPVFAQSEGDSSGQENLGQVIIDNIQNNPNLSPEQKKEMISKIQNPATGDGTVSCFKFFQLGSVAVSTETSSTSFFDGKKVDFTATVMNENDYPIAEGNLWGQILRENPSGQEKNGNHLVDQFLAADNINLGPKETKTLDFSYNLSGDLPAGKYYLATFFTASKNYEISGQATVSNIYANIISFDVVGPSPNSAYLDRNNVRMNDQIIEGRAPVPAVSAESDVKINFPLVNEKAEPVQVKLTYALYPWDSFNPESAIVTSSETVNMDASATKDLQYIVPKIQSGTYQLRITAQYPGAQSMLEVRLATDDVKQGRVDFAAISQFPLQKGGDGKMFACFHNAGYGSGDDGQITLTLADKNGKIVAKKDYSGPISGSPRGIEQDFQAASKYDYLKLTAEVKDKDGKVVDSVSTVYDSGLMASAASEESGREEKDGFVRTAAGIVILLIVLLVVYVIIKKVRSRNIVIFLILVGLSLAFAFSGHTTLAYNNSYTSQIGSDYYWFWYVPIISGSLYLDNNCLFKKGSVCIKNNDTLNVGDVITFAEQQGDWGMNGAVNPCPAFSKKWYIVGKDNKYIEPPCSYKYEKEVLWDEYTPSACYNLYPPGEGGGPSLPSCSTVNYDPSKPSSPSAYLCTTTDPYTGDMAYSCMIKTMNKPSIIPGRAYIKERAVSIAPDITGPVSVAGESVTAVQPGTTVTLTVDPTFTIRNQLYYNFSEAVCDLSDVPSKAGMNAGCYDYVGHTSCGPYSPDPCANSGGRPSDITGSGGVKTSYDIDDVPSHVGNVSMKLQFCDHYTSHDVIPPWGLYSGKDFLINADAIIHPTPVPLTLHIAGPAVCPSATLEAIPSSIGTGGISYLTATCSDGSTMPSWSWANDNPTAASLWSSTTNKNAVTGLALPGVQTANITATASNGTIASATVTVNPTPMDGKCGSASGVPACSIPTSNLCDNGTTPSVVNGSGPWSWTCSGINGSTVIDYCSTLASLNPGCGSESNAYRCPGYTIPNNLSQLCTNSTSVSITQATVTSAQPAEWVCSGTCGTKTCSNHIDTPKPGQCGTLNGNTVCSGNCPPENHPELCQSSADPINFSPPYSEVCDSYEFSWTCPGTCGASSASCSARGKKSCGWQEVNP